MLLQKDLPKPDKVVHFEAYSKGHPTPEKTGALMVFGDPSSKTMALLCAGFPDDHTVFFPFAEKLAARGILAGVICIPGYDDRPGDGVPWESHPREGFGFDELAKTFRAAAKTLRGVSTHASPELVGIFHDWGCVAGSVWAKQVEEESIGRPGKIVYFDVLMSAPKWAKTDPLPKGAIQRPSFRTMISAVYQPLLAATSTLYTFVSKHLGLATLLLSSICLRSVRLLPTYPWDNSKALYGTNAIGLMRMTHMTFLYRKLFVDYVFKKKPPIALHNDWKKMPILYLYGKNKRASFHSPTSLALLEREFSAKRSLSKAVGLDGAGHWLYNQKQEECLEHVVDFIEAENTFV